MILSWVWLLSLHLRARSSRSRIEELESQRRKLESHIQNLQKNIKSLSEREQEFNTIFVFLPELISRLTSYQERRDIFDIVIDWIDRILKPRRSYIFIEREGYWVPVVKRDPDLMVQEPSCMVDEGLLGVVRSLRKILDKDDFTLLSVEKQRLLAEDPMKPLEFQVCSPLIYEEKLYGIIALSDVPQYSKEKKVLLTMLSDLTASSLVNSILFSRFRYMASRDPLTDLVNKRGFQKAALEAIVRASREKRPFSIFIFDIDYFKKYNDTHGHQAGDEALKITANLIRKHFRSGDVKARYGGEEFVVLMEDTDKDQALQLAERFRRYVEKHKYPWEKTQPTGRLTISGGVASYPADGGTIKELIEKADEALYMAKQKGRNRIFEARSFDFSDYYENENKERI